MRCRKEGVETGPLPDLRVVVTAGSPLPPEGFHYVYEQLGPDILLLNGSGGTDVCSALVSGHHMAPVYEGEIASHCLGVDAKAFDLDGDEVVGELGELVITEPMPSMPVRFWNDPDDKRYRSSYFEQYPGVWRQGDWVRFTERGSCVITGRSDATLNRGGVRLGTSELYAVVEELPEVADSLIVHLEDSEGGAGELALFVVLADGGALDDGPARADRRRAALRALAAPRARHDRRGAGDPAHADRQEARDAGQAHPARRGRRPGGQPRCAGRPGGARRLRRARARAVTRHPGSQRIRGFGVNWCWIRAAWGQRVRRCMCVPSSPTKAPAIWTTAR